MTTITLMKHFDNWIGGFLTFLFSSYLRPFYYYSPSSILIIRPGGIGDAVLLLPMLQQLSALYPDAKLEVLAERRNAEVFSWSPFVAKVWRYDHPLEFLKLFRQHYDLIIDTEQWYRLSVVVARLLRPSRLIGFATNERSRLLSDPCPYKQDEYEAAMFLRLLVPLETYASGLPLEQSGVLVLPPPKNVVSTPYVVIFPGASVDAKQWPAERFTEVALYCEELGFGVVVVGGNADKGTAQVITRALSHCNNLVGKTSLTESASIVAGTALMISGDTGLLHVAQLLDVPTVALFGPSNPRKWSREGDRHIVVSASADCSPCSRFGTIPKCCHDLRCMQSITTDMVVKAVVAILEKKKGAAS